jgi:hypothetical protein
MDKRNHGRQLRLPCDVFDWTLHVSADNTAEADDISVMLINGHARGSGIVPLISESYPVELFSHYITHASPLAFKHPLSILRFIARQEAHLGYVPKSMHDQYMNEVMRNAREMTHEIAYNISDIDSMVQSLEFTSSRLYAGREGLVHRVRLLADGGFDLAAKGMDTRGNVLGMAPKGYDPKERKTRR